MFVLSLSCMCKSMPTHTSSFSGFKRDTLSLCCGALLGTFDLILQFLLATKSYLLSGVSIEH